MAPFYPRMELMGSSFPHEMAVPTSLILASMGHLMIQKDDFFIMPGTHNRWSTLNHTDGMAANKVKSHRSSGSCCLNTSLVVVTCGLHSLKC